MASKTLKRPARSRNAAAPEAPRTSQYAFLCDPTLSARARLLFAIIIPYIYFYGECTMTRAEIADRLGCGLREATKCIAELKQAEIFTTEYGGRGNPNIFRVGAALERTNICANWGGGGLPRQIKRQDATQESLPLLDAAIERERAQLLNLDRLYPTAGDFLNSNYDDCGRRTSSSFFEKRPDVGYGAHVARKERRGAERIEQRRSEVAARGLEPVVRRLLELGIAEPTANTLALDREPDEIFSAIEYCLARRTIDDLPSYLRQAIIGRWKLRPYVRSQQREAEAVFSAQALRASAPASQVEAAERAIEPEKPDVRSDEEWLRGKTDIFRRAVIEPRAQRLVDVPADHPHYAKKLLEAQMRIVRAMREGRQVGALA